MVEVGGEMRLSGLSGRGDAWRIAIEQPDNSLHSVAAAMSLTEIDYVLKVDEIVTFFQELNNMYK